MTAEPPQSPVSEGVRSLEVRWIFPGQLESAVAGWFGRFPARMESREDTYLLDPQLPGLSVKVRGGGALEVKMYRGRPGILEVAGRARGRMQSWQKRRPGPSVQAAEDVLVPVDHRAGDHAGAVGEQEHHEVGDLVDLPQLAHRQRGAGLGPPVVASAWTNSALAPAAARSAASASPGSRRRPVTATSAPSRAAARAMAAPRPCVPPLMSTTRSRRRVTAAPRSESSYLLVRSN